MNEWLNEGLTKGQFLLFVVGTYFGYGVIQLFEFLRKAQEK